MKRRLVYTKAFERAYRRYTKRNRSLKEAVKTTLQQLAEDAFDPRLSTHKLQGKLRELRACSCGYDCRIIFSIESLPTDDDESEEVIVLVSVGSHDDVY